MSTPTVTPTSLPFFVIALDFAEDQKMTKWVAFAKQWGLGMKVGLEAFSAFGPPLIRELVLRQIPVFVDLKLYDIPTTVLKTMDVLTRWGATAVTLHAQNGDEVWEELRKRGTMGVPRVFAVTVLTSMENRDLKELAISDTTSEYTEKLARRLLAKGHADFVCSAGDRERLRGIAQGFSLTPHFLCPGVRFGKETQDQRRLVDSAALKDRAQTCFVLGRALTQSANPDQVMKELTL